MFYYISRIILVIVLALVAAILHQGVLNTREQTEIPSQVQQNYELATVAKVIDGDTIELAGGERVRYIGIDTPEIGECFFKEAAQKNEAFVLNKNVRLVKDINDIDKYGRLLRYVFVDDPLSSVDSRMSINELLVREGVAVARSYPPDVKLQDRLREAERYARENKLGLWATNACIK